MTPELNRARTIAELRRRNERLTLRVDLLARKNKQLAQNNVALVDFLDKATAALADLTAELNKVKGDNDTCDDCGQPATQWWRDGTRYCDKHERETSWRPW